MSGQLWICGCHHYPGKCHLCPRWRVPALTTSLRGEDTCPLWVEPVSFCLCPTCLSPAGCHVAEDSWFHCWDCSDLPGSLTPGPVQSGPPGEDGPPSRPAPFLISAPPGADVTRMTNSEVLSSLEGTPSPAQAVRPEPAGTASRQPACLSVTTRAIRRGCPAPTCHQPQSSRVPGVPGFVGGKHLCLPARSVPAAFPPAGSVPAAPADEGRCHLRKREAAGRLRARPPRRDSQVPSSVPETQLGQGTPAASAF